MANTAEITTTTTTATTVNNGIQGPIGTAGKPGTTGYVGINGIVGNTTLTYNAYPATYSSSTAYVYTPSGISTGYVYVMKPEIKFGFTLRFKTSKAKLVRLLCEETMNFKPNNELKKIL